MLNLLLETKFHQIFPLWLSNLGCCGNLNVDAVTRQNDFDIFPDKFWKKSIRFGHDGLNGFKVIQLLNERLENSHPRC